MSTEFDKLLSAGFAEVVTQAGVCVSHNGTTKKCITTSFSETKVINDSGLMNLAPGVIELTRADFEALSIKDRSIISITGFSSHKFKVMQIDHDPGDPCVRLHLIIEQKPESSR